MTDPGQELFEFVSLISGGYDKVSFICTISTKN